MPLSALEEREAGALALAFPLLLGGHRPVGPLAPQSDLQKPDWSQAPSRAAARCSKLCIFKGASIRLSSRTSSKPRGLSCRRETPRLPQPSRGLRAGRGVGTSANGPRGVPGRSPPASTDRGRAQGRSEQVKCLIIILKDAKLTAGAKRIST